MAFKQRLKRINWIQISFLLAIIIAEGYRGYVILAMIAYQLYQSRDYAKSWIELIKIELERKKNGTTADRFVGFRNLFKD